MNANIADRPARIATRLLQFNSEADVHSKTIAATIIQLAALVESRNQPLFKRLKVNHGVVVVLTALRLSGEPYELRHYEIVERILMSTGGVTNLCRRLAKDGLIIKEIDPDDARGVNYKLTDKGVELSDQIVAGIHTTEKTLTGQLTVDEKEQLISLLRKLSDGILT